MVAIFGIGTLVMIYFILAGMYRAARRHTERYGLLPVIGRYLSGAERHGLEGELRGRDNAYDPQSKHYDRKKRWTRGFVRTTSWAAPIFIILALASGKVSIWMLAIGVTSAAVYARFLRLRVLGRINTYKGGEGKWQRIVPKVERIRKTRNKDIKPLHQALAPVVGIPLATSPNAWIRVLTYKEGSRAGQIERVILTLPKNFVPPEATRNQIVSTTREVMDLDAAVIARWNLKGELSEVEIAESPPPPTKTVELADIITAIKAQDSEQNDSVILGLGRGSGVVSVSLRRDSPHFGLSIGAGGGKSELAKLVASQILHHGGVVLILDIKRISHPWAKGLPNVRYARSIAEIHEALEWLHEEIDRRTKVADAGVTVEGEVLSNVGPRLLVIAEELNETTTRLRTYWTEIRTKEDPKKSPAVAALEEALFMGRQVRVNMFAVAQMMTAIAAGSGAARENMGVRILGRYTRNNWRMLVPEHEMPLRSTKPGRIQVVTDRIQECQVALLTGAEAKLLATNGIVTAFPVKVNGVVPPVITQRAEILPPPVTALENDQVRDQVEELITLSEAVKYGVVKRNLKAMLNARERDKMFPASQGQRMEARGKPRLYNADALRRWDQNVRS